MDSSTFLSAAEQAAAQYFWEQFDGEDYDPEDGGHPRAVADHADMAREMVSLLRGPLFDEVADRMLRHATEAENNDATEDAVYVFMVAANKIREWANENREEQP